MHVFLYSDFLFFYVYRIMSDKPLYTLVTGARNPILRTVTKPITKITKDIKSFCTILLDKMYEYEGIGLASPQIGMLYRIIAVTFRKEKGDNITHIGDAVMINPTITRKSDETFLFEEACLSLPGKRGEVLRHRHIKVSYLSPDGKVHTKKVSDMNAVIIQHEIDHLDGILFTDKVVQ